MKNFLLSKIGPLLLGSIAIMLFGGDIVLGINLLYDLDIHTEFLPLQKFLAESIQAGGKGWWNPYSGMGIPILADGHAGNYYLPFILFRWLGAGPNGLGLLWGLHLLYCFYFSIKLAEALGIEKRLAIFSAVIFTFSGYLTAIMSIFINAIGITHTPALLYFLFRITKFKKNADGIWLGILFSQFFCSGYFPFAFNTVVVLFIFFGLNVSWKEIKCWIVPATLAALVALLLSLPQLLPTLQLIGESPFDSDSVLGRMESNSLSPKLFLSYIYPLIWGGNDPLNFSYTDMYMDPMQRYFDFDELHNYLGILPLFFVLFSFKNVWKEKHQRSLIWLGLISLVLAMGVHFPGLNSVLSVLPGFHYFKDPAKWSVHLNLALSLLAALGLQSFLNSDKTKKNQIISSAVMGALIFLSLIFVLVPSFTDIKLNLLKLNSLPSCRDGFLPEFFCQTFYSVSPLIQAGIVVLISWILLMLPLSKNIKSTVIICFVFFELLLFETPAIPRTKESFYDMPKHIKELKSQSDFVRSVDGVIPEEIEVLGLGHLSGDIGAYYQIPTLAITSPFVTKGWAQLEAWTNEKGMIDLQRFESEQALVQLRPLLRGLNVGHVINKDLSLESISNPRPRAYLSYSTTPSEKNSQLTEYLKGCEAGNCPEALVEPTYALPPNTRSLTPATISWKNTESVIINVDALDKGVLVYSDQFYPGWEVLVNEIPQKVLLINGLFKGVKIDGPGHYQVEFSFRPQFYIWGERWFWFCWLLVLPLLGILRIRYASNNNGRR